MSCRIGYTETDFNQGIFDKDLLSPEQRGEDGEDDPADQRDDAWTRHGVARAATFGDEDHMMALQGPSRFRLTPLDVGDSRFRCRNRPVETTVWRNPAYRVGPPLAQ